MPNLKDLKNRIDSVKNTRKITKAMQMVAAAKLRRAQEAAEQGRPYAARMNAVLGGLAASAGGSESAPKLLSGSGADNVHLLVVMTGERGLCGGFNSSIVRMARAEAEKLTAAGKTVKMITVGKKGRDQLKREYGDQMINHVDLTEVKRVGYTNAHDIARDVLSRFAEGEFDVATISTMCLKMLPRKFQPCIKSFQRHSKHLMMPRLAQFMITSRAKTRS